MRIGDLVQHKEKLGFVVELYEDFCNVQFSDEKPRWLYKDVCIVVVKNPDLQEVSSSMELSKETSTSFSEFSEEPLLHEATQSCWLC